MAGPARHRPATGPGPAPPGGGPRHGTEVAHGPARRAAVPRGGRGTTLPLAAAAGRRPEIETGTDGRPTTWIAGEIRPEIRTTGPEIRTTGHATRTIGREIRMIGPEIRMTGRDREDQTMIGPGDHRMDQTMIGPGDRRMDRTTDRGDPAGSSRGGQDRTIGGGETTSI